MVKNKYIAIGVIVGVFILFALIQVFKSASYDILQVNNPFEIVVDKNMNGVADDNETMSFNRGCQYITKFEESDKLASKLCLDEYTRYAFAYLTEKYFNDVLLDKKVDISKKDENDIIVSGEKYSDILRKSGFIFKDGKPVDESAYNRRLKQIKKSDYRLYNVKSNKYHLLTCEYGRESHNYILVTKSQMPKGAKPCKVCACPDSKPAHKKPHKKHTNSIKYNPKQPPLVYSKGNIKAFAVDYTRNLVPNRLGNTSICNELVKQINSAKSTIDIAIYGYDRVPKIEQALKNAKARGVKIRLVYDIDSSDSNIYAHTKQFAAFVGTATCDKAPSGLKNAQIYTNSIMHDKFYIFDKSVVITGSANLSFTDMSDFNGNNVLLIKSPQIAQIYTKEFEQMYNSKFHYLKEKVTGKENIKVGQTLLSVYFSPVDKIIQKQIVPLVDRAEKYIYMPVFLITDEYLANALIRAKTRGVDVRLIIDATNAKNKSSKHHLLRQHGILVKTENYAGKLHSKTILIDDKYTILGSMNFSKSGERKNDENVLIVVDSDITKFFKNYFNYLWNRINDRWLKYDVSAESVFSVGSCSDGIDNDYDGKTDMEDDGCRFKPKSVKH